MKAGTVGALLLGAAAIGVGVVLYRQLKGVTDTGTKALATAQGAVSDALTKLFGRALSQAAQETTFFIVKFDGSGAQHAIPASSVNSQGQFIYEEPPQSSRTYQLYVDSSGKKHARSA